MKHEPLWLIHETRWVRHILNGTLLVLLLVGVALKELGKVEPNILLYAFFISFAVLFIATKLLENLMRKKARAKKIKQYFSEHPEREEALSQAMNDGKAIEGMSDYEIELATGIDAFYIKENRTKTNTDNIEKDS